MRFVFSSLSAAFLLTVSLPVMAAEQGDSYSLTIKDHVFSPAELKIPAGQRIRLVVENQDATPEEFESHDLKREKIVPAHGKITVNLGPLKAGKYEYSGEFHEETAHGIIIAE